MSQINHNLSASATQKPCNPVPRASQGTMEGSGQINPYCHSRKLDLCEKEKAGETTGEPNSAITVLSIRK